MLEAPKQTVIQKTASPMPFYCIAGLWVVGSFILPMYKGSSYLILGALSAAAYFILKKFVFPDEVKEVEVEVPRSYFTEVQKEFIEEGTLYLQKIQARNKLIDNPALNKEVDDLVETSDKILDYVYQHEKAASGMRKIVHYYLPTIEKLLARYDEIEDNVNVANVEEGKAKIESILKTTNEAFRNQLNSLFDDDTLDINSEVKVLEQIYVKEGLIDPEDKMK